MILFMYREKIQKNGGEIMNKKEFESYMKKYGDTQESLADAMGITRGCLNRKINEKYNAMFTQSEMAFIKRRYNLTPEEINTIFFD